MARGPRLAGKHRRKRKKKKAKKSKKTKKWIKTAIKHPGAFRKYCLRHGFPGVTAGCIAKGMKSKNPTTHKQAVLAKTLKGFH
jgi:hypothetical protein